MIEYLVLLLIIIAFTLASIEDIKKREVYDYLNFSLAFIILVIAIFHSLQIESFDPIKYAGFGMLIGFVLGAILFYLGIWGGGDAKFILGFGASSYYIMGFTNHVSDNIIGLYDFAMQLLSNLFEMLFNFFLNYLLIIDLIFIILIFLQFFLSNRTDEKKDLLFLLSILFLLLIGLYNNYSPIILIGLSFIAFVLIFIAREGVFNSVYFKYKKHLEDLKQGDKCDSDIIISHKKIINYENARLGLSKEEVHKIKDKLNSKNNLEDIWVRKTLPYSMLIALNFIMYLFKIITLNDSYYLSILSFMFKFMFYSFIAGGILAVFVVLYYYIKNHAKVKIKLSKIEKYILLIGLITSIILFSFDKRFLIVLLLVPIYLFIRIAKSVESVAFIKKKSLLDITLGDWVVQDIKIGTKIIYSKDDFKIGIDEFQLAKIQELSKTHSNLRELWVKDGIAFLPALYIGFILLFIL